MKNLFFESIGKKLRTFTELVGDAAIPNKLRRSILNYLERASIKTIPYFTYGIAIYVLIAISIIMEIILWGTRYFSNVIFPLSIPVSIILFILIFVLITIIAVFVYTLYLDAIIYQKTRQMEASFPDFLSELSINLKAGLSLDEAMENSLEKEFGYLNEEISKIAKEVKLGKDVEDAIREFTNNFKSDTIEEAFDLILVSWKKGANTSQLVDRIYDNIEIIRYLKNKVIASITSYRLFLSTITLVIAPAMFTLAFYLVDLIRSIANKVIETVGTTSLPIVINVIRINDQHFVWFLTATLIVISLFTSIIISIMKTGTIKEGYKQIAFYVAFTYISFQVFMFIFGKFFSLFNV